MPLEPRQPPLRLRAGPFVSVQRDFAERKVFFFATRLRPCPCSRKNDPHLGPSTSLRPTLFMLLEGTPSGHLGWRLSVILNLQGFAGSQRRLVRDDSGQRVSNGLVYVDRWIS